MVRTITGDKLDKVGQYSLTDLELISYQFEKEESNIAIAILENRHF